MIRIINAKTLLLILITISPLCLFSYNPPEKFGKISIDDLKSKVCSMDSNAHAYFIFDFGESHFKYADTNVYSDDPDGGKGFQLYFTRHYRIKILDSEGFSWANIEIPL